MIYIALLCLKCFESLSECLFSKGRNNMGIGFNILDCTLLLDEQCFTRILIVINRAR